MRFENAGGTPELCGALRSMVAGDRIPHAIMLHEDDGGNGFAVAMSFLQYIFCEDRGAEDSCGNCPSCNRISKLIHPDVHFVFPTTSRDTSLSYLRQFRELALENPHFTEEELSAALNVDGKSSIIAVSEAKELIDTLSMSALEGGYRAVVLFLPEALQPAAANKLLKLLEEPPSQTIFILISHAPEKVLQTIVSRCQRFRVMPSVNRVKSVPSGSEEVFSGLFSSLMDALLSRDLLAVLEAGEQIAALPNKENTKAFCKFAAEQLRVIFLLQQKMGNLCKASDDAVRWSASFRNTFPRRAAEAFDRAAMLLSRNVNVKIVFTDLCDRLSVMI